MSLNDIIETDAKSVFMNTDDFGESVIYFKNGSGGGTAIDVIWDDAFVTLGLEEGAEVRTEQPACFAAEDDIDGDADGDTILKDTVTYYVTKKLGEIGQGMVLLLLSKRTIHGG